MVQMCTIMKQWQYGFKLSSKYPSEIDKKFENLYLIKNKSLIW